MSPLEEFAKRFGSSANPLPLLRMTQTVQSSLDDIDIIPGQWILCTDTKEYYHDIANGVRIKISDTIQLNTDSDRQSIIPINGKFYFVKSTGVLWIYDSNTWTPVGTKASAITTEDGSTVEAKLATISKIGRSVQYVPVTTDGQTSFTIPFPFANYLAQGNFIEIFVGTVMVDDRRYTISGNTITFDSSITLLAGRTITFVFWYNDYSAVTNFTPTTRISASDVYLSNGQTVQQAIDQILASLSS